MSRKISAQELDFDINAGAVVGYGDQGTPLDADDYSALQGTGGTVTQVDDDTLLFTMTGANSNVPPRLFLTDKPSGAYTYERRVQIENRQNNFQGGGLLLWSTALNKGMYIQNQYNSYGGGWRTHVGWLNLGTGTENELATMASNVLPPMLRIRDDETNLYFEYSFGGKVWSLLYQQARTTTLSDAGTDLGIYVQPWYESGSARNPRFVVRSMPSALPILPGDPPTIIGANSGYASSGSTITINLPAGSAAGDRAIVIAGQGNGPSLTSGWTHLAFILGSGTNAVAMTKILDATDISNGYVVATFAGGFNGAASVIVFDGSNQVIDVLHANAYSNAVRTALFNGTKWKSEIFKRSGTLLAWLYSRQNVDITIAEGTEVATNSGSNASQTLNAIDVVYGEQIDLTLTVPNNDYDTLFVQLVVSEM